MTEMTAQIDPMPMHQTGVVQASDRPAGLKRRSVVLMLVLMVLTGGLYFPFWFLRRRAALNQLDAPTKLSQWPLLLILAGVVISILLEFPAGPSTLATVIRLATAVLALVQCFFIKQILEDHLSGPDGDQPMLKPQVTLSGLLTFFFGIFYLQYVINRRIVDYH